MYLAHMFLFVVFVWFVCLSRIGSSGSVFKLFLLHVDIEYRGGVMGGWGLNDVELCGMN